jgi:hypothetical protein
MEAEESSALALFTAQGERPFYYYCDDKVGPVLLVLTANITKHLLTMQAG